MGNNKYGQLGRRIVAGDSTTASGTGTGSQKKKSASDGEMKLVTFPNDEKCIDIDCGWHHSIALVVDDSGNNDIDTSTSSSSSTSLYGFGRNDKGQLGLGNEGSDHTKATAANTKTTLISSPTKINPIGKDTYDGVDNHDANFVIKHFSCGAESTSIVDHKDRIISCGWNEHGNLACGVKNVANDANGAATDIEIHECRHTFTSTKGADICSPQLQRVRSNHNDNIDDDGHVDVDTTTMMERRIILASGGAHLIATIV